TVGVTTDIFGNPRPLTGSTTVDIGAHEFTPPPCPAPSQFRKVSTTSNSVELEWTTGGASTWQVSYGTIGYNPDLSGTIVNVLSNPDTTISGFSASTCYEFY